jgi:hypothetical protein
MFGNAGNPLRRLVKGVVWAGDSLLAVLVPEAGTAQAADCWIEHWNDADGQGNVCWRRDCCYYGAAGGIRCGRWRALCTNCNCPP